MRFRCLSLALAACTTLCFPAHATKKIYKPYVDKGELEFELKGSHYIDEYGEINGGQKAKFGIGYGVTEYWMTELEFEREKEGESGADFNSEALEWENTLMLTQPGEYWMDVGLYGAYEYALDDDAPDVLEGKLLLAKDIGPFTTLANVTLEHEIGENSEQGLEGGFALGAHYRYSPYFKPGVEWHSELGELEDMGRFEDDQKHQFGPVAYGKVGGLPLAYDIGYLFGVSDKAPDGEIKAILEYEVYF
jgi:hypothetical protein